MSLQRPRHHGHGPVLWPPHAKSWLIGKDWCWEGLGTGGEGDNRGWDGWMASLTQWTWVWVNSGSWWWTGRPGVLRFMGSQRVGHDWATELKLNWRRGVSWDSLSPLVQMDCSLSSVNIQLCCFLSQPHFIHEFLDSTLKKTIYLTVNIFSLTQGIKLQLN